jgi:colanic acid/amylovoran biosynthesis glycosyltransferase
MIKQKNDTVIIFTDFYPYSAVADSFLDPEIRILSPDFLKIIIIPTKITKSNERIERKFPGNVIIDKSYLQKPNAHNYSNDFLRITSLFLTVIQSRHFYKEIIKNFPLIFHSLVIISLRDHLYTALQIQNLTQDYITTHKPDLSKTVFYTYWFSGVTTGIAFAKNQYPEIKLISRAHRGDIYIEDLNPPYIPFREYVLNSLDSLFLISDHGRRYFTKRYPHYTLKYKVAKLGVRDPNFSTKCSDDGIIRIVSCSYASPVKRIDLIIQGIAELNRLKPDQRIKWVHIGYGPLLPKLKELSEKCLTKNIEYSLLGYLGGEVIQFYKKHCVDIFINTSASEGIPVSIMEAQSCGIPVIATDVGGTSEIISNKVGVLLGQNPTPFEIASAICSLLNNPEQFMEKRHNSKENWNTNFNAEKNFSAFAHQLKEI